MGDIEHIDWAFDKSVHDMTMMMEVNYLRYILGAKNTPFSPYIMAGIGVMYYPYNITPGLISSINKVNANNLVGNIPTEESVIAMSIPFGMGIKATFGKRLGVGVEVQFRKLMDDKLDDLNDPFAHTGLVTPAGNTEPVVGQITYADAWHNNDYVAFWGINLTYSINLSNEVCPVYDSKK